MKVLELMFRLIEESLSQMNSIEFFFSTVFSFLVLYFIFALAAYFLFTKKSYFNKFQTKPFRPGQIRLEIARSMVSILMFGLLSFFLYEGLRSGFLKIKFEFTWPVFITESSALFFWNEIYFYLIHRLFHTRAFYKFHAHHHYSHVPSPFSAYSFHWSEGLLLGAVMPIIMCVHDFQLVSLLTLPLMSIFMNVLGHSNVDFFPRQPVSHLLSFSKRHSLHHKVPSGNYGFFLPYFDRWFKTEGSDRDF